MGSMPYQEEASAGSTTPEATAIAESKPKEENPPATAVEKPMDKTQLDKTEKGIAKNIGKKNMLNLMELADEAWPQKE
jgi:hypothetical protein